VSGVVEQINLRHDIVLRDGEGAVQVFPNGTVTTLANLSKQFRLRRGRGEGAVLGEPGSRVRDDSRSRASMQADRSGPASSSMRSRFPGVIAIADGQATISTKFKTLPAQPGRGGQRTAATPARRARRRRHQTLLGIGDRR
jgi:small conductance mechanosensitive channel